MHLIDMSTMPHARPKECFTMHIPRRSPFNPPPLLRACSRTVALAVAALALTPAIAQSPPAKADQPDRPAQDPSLTSPGAEDAMLDSQRRPSPPPPIKPTRERPGQRTVPAVPSPSSTIPGLRAFDYSVPGAKAFPEGTFLLTKRGVVVQSDTGEYVFVPGKEAPTDASPSPVVSALTHAPLVLMPSQRVAQLTARVTSPAEAVPVSVSGQVFSYRGRHYLLLSMFNFETSEPIPSAASSSKPKAERSRATAEASAEDLMGDLEKRTGTTRALAPTESTSVPMPGANAPPPKSIAGLERLASTLRPEGTVLTGKRGRIVRSGGDRAISIAIDNDPDSPSSSPMPLLPCRLLETLESLVGQRGDSLLIRFSGRVTVFQGRNYLLPTMYQVIRPGDVAPLQ